MLAFLAALLGENKFALLCTAVRNDSQPVAVNELHQCLLGFHSQQSCQTMIASLPATKVLKFALDKIHWTWTKSDSLSQADATWKSEPCSGLTICTRTLLLPTSHQVSTIRSWVLHDRSKTWVAVTRRLYKIRKCPSLLIHQACITLVSGIKGSTTHTEEDTAECIMSLIRASTLKSSWQVW